MIMIIMIMSRHPLRIHPSSPETSAVDWPCTSNGWGPHSQATLVRRTSTRKTAGRTTVAPFQGRGEEGHAGHWSSNRFVGDSCQWQQCVDNKLHRSPTRGRKASAHYSGYQERMSEGQGPCSTHWFHLCLWFLSLHLPIKNRTPKPSQKMFKEMYNY